MSKAIKRIKNNLREFYKGDIMKYHKALKHACQMASETPGSKAHDMGEDCKSDLEILNGIIADLGYRPGKFPQAPDRVKEENLYQDHRENLD